MVSAMLLEASQRELQPASLAVANTEAASGGGAAAAVSAGGGSAAAVPVVATKGSGRKQAGGRGKEASISVLCRTAEQVSVCVCVCVVGVVVIRGAELCWVLNWRGSTEEIGDGS